MSDVMNQPFYRNFVSPTHCKDLHEFGLQVNLSCQWNLYDRAVLRCYLFDFEDYYRDNEKNIDQLNPPRAIWPAFQIGDLDLLLPNYCLSRDHSGFILSIENNYQVAIVTDKRMPDVFARMVVACLRARVLLPNTAINKLKNQL
ncbi:MAG: hypothetical protein V4594_16775 [Bacteroidota bacterium]